MPKIGDMAMSERLYRLFEFVALFGAMPAIFAFGALRVHVFMLLASACVVCWVWLARDRTFDRRKMWNWEAGKRELPRILGRWLPLAGATALITWFFVPELFFALPRERPGLWLTILVAYPLVSVLMQNVVYRNFVWHRYGEALGRWALPMTAAAFSWAHVLFHNGIALGLTFIGGLLFGHTYRRSGSGAAAAIEHALYGCTVFTVGLGWYLVQRYSER